MKIGILGAGSLGTIIGALITKSGFDVDLIDVNEAHVDALNQDGAKIVGYLEQTIPVKAILPSEVTDNYDLLILLTKQVFTESALKSILQNLNEDSIVCTLQNGVPEDLVAEIVGSERTIGGAVGWGATWIEPGVAELTTEMETVKKFAFDIGELDGSHTERLERVKKVLDSVGETLMVDNIMNMKWTKLSMNTTLSGMSAALGCTFGDVLANDDAMNIVANIADETIKVAREHGIELIEMQGINFPDFEIHSQTEVDEKIVLHKKLWAPHHSLKASMLQDLEKGIKSEIDYINGHVVKKGQEKGIETPFNSLVVELVSKAEKLGKVPKFDENIIVFREFYNDFVK